MIEDLRDDDGDGDDDEDEDGAGRRRRRKKKRRPAANSAPRPVQRPRTIMDRMLDAYTRAEAIYAVNENGRANGCYGLTQANPATAIAAGASATATVTLNDDSWIQHILAVDTDAVNFLLKSLKVNGYEMVKSGPVNLAAFSASLNRIDRPTPLTGRKFKNGAKLEMEVVNIAATAQLFHGLSVWVNEPICDKDAKGSSPAPGVTSFRTVQRHARFISPPGRPRAA